MSYANRIRDVLQKFALAIGGYFVVFDLFLISRWAVQIIPSKEAVPWGDLLSRLWTLPSSFLTLPFLDLYASLTAVYNFTFRIPDEVRAMLVATGRDLNAVVVQHSYAAGKDILLFVGLALAVYLFECTSNRKHKEIMVFYFFIPGVIWLLWLQLLRFL
ncbi:MAG: hypothetical protein AB199_04365 [Parcubacteria bacterium C7867-004]|nr:MAG: hypothetical protein AB199_04365 [Parcubacteria bacterium C7867-004]